jgi:hypothetical protein
MGIDGSGVRTLARARGGANPIWISDRTIAFTRRCVDNACPPGVFAVSADGGAEQLLIPNAYGVARRP